MADQQISVQFTADASPMTAELRVAVNELKKLELALKKSTDISEINKLTNDIDLLKVKITSLGGVVQQTGTKLGTNLKSGVNNASFAVNDLNRVVQDLPYGFIGISNNINPLLESFTRLKSSAKESGTTLGTELLGALTGPSGLALAVAAVTTAITFAQIGLSRWISSSKDTSSELGHLKQVISELEIATKASKVEFDNYATSLDRIQELSKLDIRLNITGQGDLADYKRQLALLKLEKDTLTEKIGAGVSVFGPGVGTGAVKNLIEARKVLDQLNNIVSSKAPATYTNTLIGNATDAKLAYDKVIESFGGLDNAYLATDEQLSNLDDDQKASIKAYGNQQKVVQDLEKQLGDLNQQLRINAKTTQVVQQVEKDRLAALQKDLPSVDKLLAKLKEDLKDQANISIGLDIDTTKEQIGLIDTAIKKLISDFNLPTDDSRIVNLKIQLDELKKKQFQQEVGDVLTNLFYSVKEQKLFPVSTTEDLKKELSLVESAVSSLLNLQKKFGTPIEDNVIGPLIDRIKQLKQAISETVEIPMVDITLPVTDLDKQLKSIGEKVQSMAEETGLLFASALGNAFTGNTFDFIGNFYEILGSGLIAIGKQLFKIAGLAELVQNALSQIFSGPMGPAFAVAAGIAAVALGTAIRNLKKNSAFAIGTNYAPGGMALVGERGPELINLPRGSQVVPAAQTSTIMKGASQQVEVYGVLRGQDIYFSNKKYSQTYNRTT